MEASALLPASSHISIDGIRIEPTFVEVRAHANATSRVCPTCLEISSRVHSRYERTVRALPWRGTPVKIRFLARRFFCDNPVCDRLIFSEQLEELVVRRGQSTPRFNRKLLDIGLEAGGEPGARLSIKLGIPTSGPTILRRLRGTSLPAEEKPSVIGVDDFALKRGQVYGTLFVDHHSHRVIDIIPDRSSESTAAWLRRHESIRIVTRDRSALYAKGIRNAQPDAVQVADRWHLLHNAREALIDQLDRDYREVTAAHAEASNEMASKASASDVSSEPPASIDSSKARAIDTPVELTVQRSTPTKAQLDSQVRRERRLERYHKIIGLRQQGAGIRAIARALGVSRNTVQKFIRAASFPEHSKRCTRKGVDPFVKQIRAWWDAGIHNAREIHRRAKELGFVGSWFCIRRLVAPWRDPRLACSGPRSSVRVKAPLLSRFNSNRLSWLLIRDEIDRAEDESLLLTKLLFRSASIATATRLCREFGTIVRSRDETKMRDWIRNAMAQVDSPAMASFATGLRQTQEEVCNAMTHHWSNGRAEGHVNRIKMIKRKMYGRANFDLLRIRVLAGAK